MIKGGNMNEQNFLTDLTELLDTEEEISLDTNLEYIEEWDSLSYVSFVAIALSKYKVAVAKEEIKGAKTVKDLYKAVCNG